MLASRPSTRARAVVDAHVVVTGDRTSYAITTGVGQLSDVRIPHEQIRELQVNLLRSHAVGVGEPLSVPETRAMMLLRANSLSKGYSGVRAVVIDGLCEMLEPAGSGRLCRRRAASEQVATWLPWRTWHWC